MGVFQRLRDVIYAGFFLVHLGTSTLMDTQLLFDRKLFPKVLIDLFDQYVKDFKDPLVAKPPVWFKSIIHFQLLFQVPFLVVGFFGALAGARWMRTPTIIYATSVVTASVPLIAHILQENFKGQVGPQTPNERLPLLGIYGGFMLAGLVILIDHALLRPQQPASYQAKITHKEGKINNAQKNISVQKDVVKEKKKN